MKQFETCNWSILSWTRIRNSILVTLWALLLDTEHVNGQVLAGSTAPPRHEQVSDYVRRVFQDRSGNLWLGTNSDGVALYDGKTLRFFTVEDGLAGRAVRSILQDQRGAIWFATDNGLSRYFDGRFENFTTKDGLNDNDTWCLAEDHSQTIWVGTQKGVCGFKSNRFNPLELPPVKLKNPISKISPNLVWSIFVDRSGELWIGTDGSGLYQFNGRETRSLSTTDGLPSNQVSSIVQDQSGRLWLGFVSGGVCHYDGNSFHSYGQTSALPDGWVWTMLIDRQGDLLVSVLGSGVHRFKDDQFRSIEASQLGLPSHVQSMIEDAQGDLWLGCSGGLFRWQSGRLINFNKNGEGVNLVNATANGLEQLKHFDNLVSGAWVVTSQTGKKMVHTWKWGPGQKSIERWTEGESASGDPWRELMVYYWEAQEQQIHLLGISPFAEGIARGVIDYDGRDALATVRLSQSKANREMQTLWHFKDSDHYLETLLEKEKTGKYFELVSFEHVRVSNPEAYEPEVTDIPPSLQGLSFILGDSWKAELPAELGETARASITWIPTAKFYYGKVFLNSKVLSEDVWANLYVYRDVESKTLRCLILTLEPAVYQGELENIGDGTITVRLQSRTPDFPETSSATVEMMDNSLLFRNIDNAPAVRRSLELQWTRN